MPLYRRGALRGLWGHAAAALLEGSLQALEFRSDPCGLCANACGLLHALDTILEHGCPLIFRLEAFVLSLERIKLLALFFEGLHAGSFLAPRFRINLRFLRYRWDRRRIARHLTGHVSDLCGNCDRPLA